MTTSRRRKRPIAVAVVTAVNGVLVSIYLFIYSFALFAGIYQVYAHGEPLVSGGQLTELGVKVASAAVGLIAGLVGLVLLVGFVRTRWWAWVGFMIWAGLNLAVGLVRYALGRPDFALLILGVIVVFALSQSEVREAFGIYGREHRELVADD